MEYGGQCVIMLVAGITMVPELCVDNWGIMSTQEEVSWSIHWGKGLCSRSDVSREISLLIPYT